MFGVYFQSFTPSMRKYTTMPCAHFGISGCKGTTLFIHSQINWREMRSSCKDLTKYNFIRALA